MSIPGKRWRKYLLCLYVNINVNVEGLAIKALDDLAVVGAVSESDGAIRLICGLFIQQLLNIFLGKLAQGIRQGNIGDKLRVFAIGTADGDGAVDHVALHGQIHHILTGLRISENAARGDVVRIAEGFIQLELNLVEAGNVGVLLFYNGDHHIECPIVIFNEAGQRNRKALPLNDFTIKNGG